MFFNIAQRWVELQTISQMKNVLLVSKVFCICVRAYVRDSYMRWGIYTLTFL